jgi:hypothetical protein
METDMLHDGLICRDRLLAKSAYTLVSLDGQSMTSS